MKSLLGLFIVSTLSLAASAQANCGTDIHPKEKAECLLKQTVADGSNAEINNQIQSFVTTGLTPSGEISSAFVGGTCAANVCSFKYIVSTDYYSASMFKSVVVIIEAAQGAGVPKLTKVLQQTDLQ